MRLQATAQADMTMFSMLSSNGRTAVALLLKASHLTWPLDVAGDS